MVKAEAKAVIVATVAYVDCVEQLKNHQAKRGEIETKFGKSAKYFAEVMSKHGGVVDKLAEDNAKYEKDFAEWSAASDKRKRAEEYKAEYDNAVEQDMINWVRAHKKPIDPETIVVPEKPTPIDDNFVSLALLAQCKIAQASDVFECVLEWCREEDRLVRALTSARSKLIEARNVYGAAVEEASAKNEARIAIENAERNEKRKAALAKKAEAEKVLAELGDK